jgi:hypothetical protein
MKHNKLKYLEISNKKFHFPEFHGICLKHHDDADVDDNDSSEDITNIHKFSGFLEGFFKIICMLKDFNNTSGSFNHLEPYRPLIQGIQDVQVKEVHFLSLEHDLLRQ